MTTSAARSRRHEAVVLVGRSDPRSVAGNCSDDDGVGIAGDAARIQGGGALFVTRVDSSDDMREVPVAQRP